MMGSYSHALAIPTLTTKTEAAQVVSIISDVRDKRLQGDDSLSEGFQFDCDTVVQINAFIIFYSLWPFLLHK